MALVKSSRIANPAAPPMQPNDAGDVSRNRIADVARRRARNVARQQKAAERIAAATAELESGVAQASGASKELKRSLDQIATGAMETGLRWVDAERLIGVLLTGMGDDGLSRWPCTARAAGPSPRTRVPPSYSVCRAS